VVPQLQASLFLLGSSMIVQDIVQIRAEAEQQTYSNDDQASERNDSS